jgi:hypothetical protein
MKTNQAPKSKDRRGMINLVERYQHMTPPSVTTFNQEGLMYKPCYYPGKNYEIYSLKECPDVNTWNPCRFEVMPEEQQYEPCYYPGKYNENIIGYRIQLFIKRWKGCSCSDKYCDAFAIFNTKKEAEDELKKVLEKGIFRYKPKRIIRHEIIPMYPSNYRYNY